MGGGVKWSCCEEEWKETRGTTFRKEHIRKINREQGADVQRVWLQLILKEGCEQDR